MMPWLPRQLAVVDVDGKLSLSFEQLSVGLSPPRPVDKVSALEDFKVSTSLALTTQAVWEACPIPVTVAGRANLQSLVSLLLG